MELDLTDVFGDEEYWGAIDEGIGSIHTKSTKACGDQVTDFFEYFTSFSSICLVLYV